MLNPEDLKKKTFTKGFRGYEVEEVDKFLAKLIKEYEYLYLDNLEQKETIERVSSKLEYYQQMEATMQSTLAVAQETADEVKNASEKKAALLEKETAVKCEQQLSEAKAAGAEAAHDDTMAHAEDLYNQTKNKTDNMLQAAMAECNKLREEAKSYAEKLRSSAEVDADKLRITTEDVCKKRANSAASEANKLLEDARSEAGRMMLDANTKYRKLVGDAEERSRKIIFEADAKAAMAEQAYNEQVKKAGAASKKYAASVGNAG